MIDPALSEKLIAGGVIALTIVADFIKSRVDKSTPSKKADEKAAAAIDIDKVLLDHDKAHLEELHNVAAEHKAEIEQFEVRELHLTAQCEELIQQIKAASALHLRAMDTLAADRQSDHRALENMRERLGLMREDLAEKDRELELTRYQLNELRASFARQEEGHRNIVRALRNKGINMAAKAEKAGATFTKTDVYPRDDT